MGLLKSALKTGIALKAIDIARKEASKPENQRKAKELFTKISNRGATKPASQPRGPEV